MDMIDVAQRRQQEDIEHALEMRPRAKAGRVTCANLDCDEAILPIRTAMGAQLCIDCQGNAEHASQTWPRGAV